MTTGVLTMRRLRVAEAAIGKLQAEGVGVLNIHHNGRRPVLLVDRRPAFVRGVLCRRQPATGGVDRIYATPYHGAQIEWAEFVPFAQEDIHVTH